MCVWEGWRLVPTAQANVCTGISVGPLTLLVVIVHKTKNAQYCKFETPIRAADIYILFHLFCIEQFVFGHFRCGNGTNIYTLYPWIHQHCNNRSNEDQTRPITFPDVNPMELSEQRNSNFSMAAGDFLEVYTEPGMLTSTTRCLLVTSVHRVITVRNEVAAS